MIARSSDMNKDPFRPQENDEKLFDLKVPYLCVIRTLMYMLNFTLLDITFTINLLATYSYSLTHKYIKME